MKPKPYDPDHTVIVVTGLGRLSPGQHEIAFRRVQVTSDALVIVEAYPLDLSPEPPPSKVDFATIAAPGDVRTNDGNKAMLRRLHRDMVRRGGR